MGKGPADTNEERRQIATLLRFLPKQVFDDLARNLHQQSI